MLLLPVKGIRLDTIAESAATQSQITDDHQIKTLLDLLARFPQPLYPDGTPPIEAFWKTVIKDTFLGRPADDKAREAFPSLIARLILELQVAIQAARDAISPSDPDPIKLTDLSNLLNLHSETKSTISALSAKYFGGDFHAHWESVM